MFEIIYKLSRKSRIINKIMGLLAPIISRNVVIGAYAVILGGITIGEGTIIGAGSPVLENIPSNTIFYNQRIKKTKANNKALGHY